MAVLATAGFLWQKQTAVYDRGYLVEVNRIMKGMEEKRGFFMPDLRDIEQIEAVSFLPYAAMGDTQQMEAFLHSRNGYGMHIVPLVANGEMLGLVRFDYSGILKGQEFFWFLEALIVVSALFILTVLVYIRNRILKPFAVLSNMPYELSRGRLGTEIEENKNRFFGKFVWGISMLRDNLQTSRMKALKLEKEKKLLLLSISHDIKTPLNSIKLYAKALKENLYDTEEEKRHAAGQIEKLSGEIEGFVREIVKTSSEELVPMEVENSEFYLKDFVKMIKEYYEPKCRLVMTEFVIGGYENKLIKGSQDRAFEVVENIMENAFKYGDGREIAITFCEEENCQLIRIRNTGLPVKMEEMPHLFDSFYRGSNTGRQEGNGLGLYICRELMRKMEGEIFAEAEEDGMSFLLVFPM